ncbi:hypothetical protein [Christiangramia sediminis]|uniref:Uncharacterized protein n=1 Tax=Christiangramia sediminis TaxID=2881336 RepID=A0A9X1LKJ9_9FLAO|nr:hypothetical protein [Christiangramia sediminis]MCB7482129.1 hypothetical protein [Christiangramia sediminis]
MKKITLFILLISFFSNAQNLSIENSEITNKTVVPDTSIVDVTIKNGVENPDLQTLFQFENINQTEFTFKGNSITGKYFVIKVKEFLDGELINTSVLFDERGNDYFKIDSAQSSFKLLSKIGKEDIKFWIKGERYGSKQAYFPTTHDNGRYAVKDFFGAKKLLKEDINSPFYIMSVITPNRDPDGSGSYCKVAQSEISPEDFGNEFNIPHYYLVEIQFTK